MNWTDFLLLLLGALLGFFGSIIANHYTQPVGHWFFSLRGIRNYSYWFHLFNNGNKIIHKCSLIQKCTLEEFSAMSSDFVEGKFTKNKLDNKYVIFNTLEPYEFYNDIKHQLRLHSELFDSFELNIKVKKYQDAKNDLIRIKKLFDTKEIRKYKHLKHLDRFKGNRIQFNKFDISKSTIDKEFIKRNTLDHFIFFRDFVNNNVNCFWVFDETVDGIIGIDGIIINDKYLLDYNSKSSSLFYAKSKFNNFDQKDISKEPHYNKYLDSLNNNNNSINMIHIDIVGKIFYCSEYENYISA